jgi:ubiquitin carboxyl-terminal hydrolase 7
LLPDLEVDAEGHDTWNITHYRSLSKREHGPTFEVGGEQWRILLFPFGNNVDHASFYLEHVTEEDKPTEDWYKCVQFTLVLWNKHEPTILTSHTANHRFTTEEADWGFTRFAEVRKMFAGKWENHDRPMIENDEVNVTAYVRIYKDPTGVLWHNFNGYDSKKQTGMVGLKNLGATCYLNSLLQSLYFTNAFRKAVYQIPTQKDTDRSNSAWALQRLFHQLETNEGAVSTNDLTLSFGWETRQIFEQQDVQELSRVLMERMEERMKGTEAENALANMFVGKMKTFITCINVPKESSRIEDFWDIQLNVSGNRNLDESFIDYIQVETMDGDNKYFAEGFGLQDAKKGVIFESFPQVLHLQLKRFEYDMQRDAMMKVNDRHEFPDTFDASPYLSDDADKAESYIYKLHGVLVHSGDLHAGHYYAFLKPHKDGHWYRFDDDRVTRATEREALDDNFGGEYPALSNGNTGMRNPYTRTVSTKRSMSAYMLVYIRESRIDSILEPVAPEITPAHIAEQLKEEKAMLERKRKDKEEQHLYLQCAVVREDHYQNYEGFDLATFDADKRSPSAPIYYRLPKVSTVGELCATIADDRKIPADHIRLWVMVNRQNKTFRPDQPLLDTEMTVEEAFAKHVGRDRSFRLWAEETQELVNGKPVWPETQTQTANNPPLLIFLKHFDIEAQTLTGVGHIYLKKFSKVSEMIPLIQKMMGWTQDSVPNLALYEEIKHTMIEPLKSKQTLGQAELQDGDIVCFQKAVTDQEIVTIQQSGRHATAKEFYDYLLNRVTLHLYPRFSQNQDGEEFDLVVSKKSNYDKLAAQVGEQLDVDPTHIRFLTVTTNGGKPKSIVKRTANQTLQQILNPQFTYNSNQRNDTLLYEVLEMSLEELEKRKPVRITWVTEGLTKEEVYELLVPKTGTIEDLAKELQRKANLSDEVMQDVKLYTCQSNKITKELLPEMPVSTILDYASTQTFAERAPKEDLEPEEGDRLIWAYHFDKEPTKPHGIPFKFYLKPVSFHEFAL